MLVVNKPIGWTSNQLIDYIKNNFNEFKNSKISYAGRLDPMAHGLMILLIDDECKRQNEFICKKKIYKSQILLGITTDTYDILGIPILYENNINYDSQKIKNVIKSFIGNYNQYYQNYSSICVKSYITNERKPLWKWSKENRLNEIIIPKKLVNIYNISIDDINIITSKELLDIVLNKIALLTQGNFRKELIIDKWKNLLLNNNKFWYIVNMESYVSSGTYIRTLSYDIGTKLNTYALALDINRIKIDNIQKPNLLIK